MNKITIDRAVVEQALEALRAMNPYPASKEDQRASALAALRTALTQQAEPRNQCGETCERAKLCATCAQALAQQDEPDHETRAELAEQQVVQLAEERDHYRNLWQKAQQAEPAQEPVAEVFVRRDGVSFAFWLKAPPPERTKLYTAPPQRKPLTEEEIGRFCDEVYRSPRQLVRAVERAHGIKE